jgi:hypothetical protein
MADDTVITGGIDALPETFSGCEGNMGLATSAPVMSSWIRLI